MLNITRQQVLDRLDNLPVALNDALSSPIYSQIIWKTGEDMSLTEDKTRIVSRLAAYVLMGFIHPEDLAKEIQDALGINPQIASSISSTLNTRVFGPLRAVLDKIYSPAAAIPAPPKIVEEVKAPEIPVPVKETAPVATKPPLPTPTKPIASSIPQPAPVIFPTKEAVVAPKPPVVPPPPAPAAKPAPVIIHQETEVAPLKPPTPSFRLEIKEKSPFEKAAPSAPAPVPAKIEMGSTTSPQVGMPGKPPIPKPTISRTEMPEQRIVHYSGPYTLLETPDKSQLPPVASPPPSSTPIKSTPPVSTPKPPPTAPKQPTQTPKEKIINLESL